MKKFYASMIASAMALAVNAQTLTQSSNAPANGDMYSTYQCDSLNINPGASGAGANWNFSTLTIHNSVLTNYTTMVATQPGYPPGCLVTIGSVNDQSYYMPSATDLGYYGGNFKVQTATGTFIYSAPAVAASYPMSLNTTSTAAIAGTVNLTTPTSLSATFTGTSKTLADGSGTLMLPGGALGTYTNVLRVLTTQTLNYATPAGAPFPVSGIITKVNYDYYTPSTKAPLMSIAMFTLTNSLVSPSSQTLVTINKSYLQTPVSINENKISQAELSVFPNPASSQVNFISQNKIAGEIRIFDITGKLIETKALSEGSLKLDVSSYNKGIYMYSLLNHSGETLKSGKITVN